MSDPLAWLVLTNLMKSDLANRMLLWGELANTAKCRYTQFHAKQEYLNYSEQYRLIGYFQADLIADLGNNNE